MQSFFNGTQRPTNRTLLSFFKGIKQALINFKNKKTAFLRLLYNQNLIFRSPFMYLMPQDFPDSFIFTFPVQVVDPAGVATFPVVRIEHPDNVLPRFSTRSRGVFAQNRNEPIQSLSVPTAIDLGDHKGHFHMPPAGVSFHFQSRLLLPGDG